MICINTYLFAFFCIAWFAMGNIIHWLKVRAKLNELKNIAAEIKKELPGIMKDNYNKGVKDALMEIPHDNIHLNIKIMKLIKGTE